MTPFLYVQDDLELARRGEETGLGDAQAEVTARAEDAQTKQETLTEAHTLTAAMNTARAALQTRLNDNRAEADRFRKNKTEDALTNYATTDHAANAEAYGRLAQDISWLTLAITTCDAQLMPAQILNQQRAEAVLLRAMGNLFAARAIEAAVERHAAAKDLLTTDSVVTFGDSGRAHDILKISWEWHRRGSEAEHAISLAETRLSLIKAAEGTIL